MDSVRSGGRNVWNNDSKGRIALVDQLYSKIREKIVTWQIAPNDIIVELALAKEYNVSKTPVREALALLSKDGLVKILPRVGYQVTPVSIQDVHEVFDLRILLEGEAVTRVAYREVKTELGALLEKDRARARSLTLDGASLKEYLDFHDMFHLGIAELCGNARLAGYIRQLLWDGARLRMANPLMYDEDGIKEEQKDSKLIVQALLKGNAEKARKLLQEHICQAKERVIARIASIGSRSVAL